MADIPFFSEKKLLIFFLCSFFFLLDGCSAVQRITKNIRKPTLSVEHVRVTGFSFNELKLAYDVAVDNPNPFSVDMLAYDYDLKINTHSFLSGEQQKHMTIEKSGKSTLEIPVKLNFKDIYSSINSLKDKNKASYTFLSHIDFDLPALGKTEIPVKKQGSIPLLKVPSVTMKDLVIDHISFSEAKLILVMDFNNPNGFDLIINSFDYDFNVNDKNWVRGETLKMETIGKDATTQLRIPFTVNINDMGSTAYQMLSNSKKLDYNLDGDFTFSTSHPLLKSTKFTIKRSGKISLSR